MLTMTRIVCCVSLFLKYSIEIVAQTLTDSVAEPNSYTMALRKMTTRRSSRELQAQNVESVDLEEGMQRRDYSLNYDKALRKKQRHVRLSISCHRRSSVITTFSVSQLLGMNYIEKIW